MKNYFLKYPNDIIKKIAIEFNVDIGDIVSLDRE